MKMRSNKVNVAIMFSLSEPTVAEATDVARSGSVEYRLIFRP